MVRESLVVFVTRSHGGSPRTGLRLLPIHSFDWFPELNLESKIRKFPVID